MFAKIDTNSTDHIWAGFHHVWGSVKQLGPDNAVNVEGGRCRLRISNEANYTDGQKESGGSSNKLFVRTTACHNSNV